MKEEKTFICEFCGKRGKNPKTMLKHELECKATYDSCRQLENRLQALFELLRKQGYKLELRTSARFPQNDFIAVSKDPPKF